MSKRREGSLISERPAEVTGVAAAGIGSALAFILAVIFGFRDDAELVRAVDTVIMWAIGFSGTLATWRQIRKGKR